MQSKTLAMLLITAYIVGCSPLITDKDKYVAVFTPSIGKDGTQTFTFIANKELPSLLSGQSAREVHEAWISSELGKRQFCMKGYEITSVTKEAGEILLYKGQCK